MPKGGDPLCPLGFHPQTRWPNRCKRCFRDYNDHKAVKEASGSTTSLNSLSSYDTGTTKQDDGKDSSGYGSRDSLVSSSRVKDEVEGYRRTRSDLTPDIIAKANEEYDRDQRAASKLNSWDKSRPVSWSAQDLRKAVDDAKEQIRSSREDLHRLYGSTKSLSQGLDSDLRDSSNDLSTKNDSTFSFSSYLAMRTKSPARPPLGRTSSLQGTASTSSSARRSEEEATPSIKEEKEKETKSYSSYSSYSSESKSSRPSSLAPISEAKSSRLSTEDKSDKAEANGKPPKPPSRLKLSSKLLDIKETPREEKPKKNILSLKGEGYGSGSEVKSEDDSADATYVIKLAKPKKEPKKVEIDLQSELERVQQELKEKNKEIKELEERTDRLESENKELSAKKPKFGDVRKHTELSKLQQKLDDLNDEMKSKNKEVKDLKKEIDKRPLPKDVEKTMEDLRSKLQAAEQLCEELMDENEDYKKEVRALEEEIEEMQDNFREEQADEYRDLKRELEQTAKNCRVLQFKLKKAERRSDTLERDKGEIEDKLKELQVGEGDVDRSEKVKTLEKEVNLAKEVSMKMHEEMEKMKRQLEEAEKDKKKLTEQCNDKPIRPGGKYSRSQLMARQGSQDNTDQLLRDLKDAGEREQDLKDQLKFAEEETKNLRKKLSRVEEENETLALQLKKMTTKAKANRQRSLERSGSLERSSSVERGTLSRQGSTEKPSAKEPDEGITEDLDPTELKIQLELNEQEAAVLRRKVEDLESENERLQKNIKEVLSTTDSKSRKADVPLDIKKLEKEMEILKTRVEQTETENEKLSDENKRLQLKAVKRLPLTGGETSYIERQVMEDKVRRLEKKLKEATTKLKDAQVNAAVAGGELEGKAGEAGGVASKKLMDEVKEKDNAIGDLKKKVDSLQEQYDKVRKECDDMKNASAYKDRTPKKPRDLTPKSTLVKWVDELETECATLNVKLKFMEIEKQVLEEMTQRKRDPNNAVDGEMCHLLFAENENLKSHCKFLKDKADAKEAETRQQRRRVRELEGEREKMEEQMKGYKEIEQKVVEVLNSEERAYKRASEYTPKSALRQMVDELNRECGKSVYQQHISTMTTSCDENKASTHHITLLSSAGRTTSEDDIRRYEEKVESLKKEVAKEKERYDDLKTKVGDGKTVGFEELRSAQSEKHRLQKELSTAQQTTEVLEKKLKEAEENLRLAEKAERKSKYVLEQLESKLEEEKNSLTAAEERQKEMTMSWLREREDLKKEITEAKKTKEKAERELRTAKKSRDQMETMMEDEKRRTEDVSATKKKDADEIKRLKADKEGLSREVDELKDAVNKLEKSKENVNYKQKRDMENLRKEKEDLEIRMTTLESELKSEQKRRERLEKDSERGSSVVGYAARKSETEAKKLKTELENVKKEYDEKIKELEKQMKKEKEGREELQSKYDLLEEDYVVQKAQMTVGIEDDYQALKKDHDTIEIELKTLRETYNIRQDTWIKEKLDMQEQLKDLENRLNKVSIDPTSYSEKKRLKDIIEDKNQQIEKLRRDVDGVKDQASFYRRESEELRRKVDDLEKLNELNERRTNSLSTADKTSFDTTIRELRSRLSASEKNYKTELTKIKMKYDSKLKAMTEEVSTLTQHMTKYRRERDTYKEMLDGAQRNIAELKGNVTYRTSRADNATEIAAVQRVADLKAQQHLIETQELQSQITELEDKLADSRLESTKIKNELVDQKTNFEIQLCDLQTKLNEYEEDRLLVGGSRRVPGLRTRLELNWQKEREEQQRLIQETATLAKDLRQTLYEVERERDLERLEAKRKIEQLKKTVGQGDVRHQEQSAGGKRETLAAALQRDLMELREAHAKLRQINEKLRREKDRTEVEREAMRDKYLGSSRDNLNQAAKMERLTEEMKKVKDLAPLVLGEGIDGRDSSLTRLPGDPKPKTKEEFTDSLKRACRTMEEMKRMMNLMDDRDRLKRAPSFRRALSVEDSEDEGPPSRPRSAQRGSLRPRGHKSSLYRKTQSLDHQMAEDRGKIWVSTDAGSTTSIDSTLTDDLRRAKYDRDVSLDRISTGSQTSDLDPLGDKKRKGIKGMISKLTKSRSIEESATGGSIVGAGVKAMGVGVGGSGNDIPSDVEKDSVKGKLKGLFKKGPPSRSQSVDRADGSNVKKIASSYDYDTASMASNTSLESNTSANIPPVMRRFRGRSQHGAMTKAQSFTAIGRQSSLETDV
ncbi:trichohyalin-like [Penaeus chinensis]|uniref:trichohyalin-like n=1 Tax=Penaeus chinensis TaxID=139456 RepID=UPI001FB5E494|nr:trichohyalin-like [Penaeus chinensis]